MARPRLTIDEKVVEGMASVGATDVEISDFVGCSESTIRSRFRGILTKARSGMRTRLRQAQFKLAIGGNATMLIWLGKQMLNQKDRTDLTSDDRGLQGSGVLAVPVPVTAEQWGAVAAAQQAALVAKPDSST